MKNKLRLLLFDECNRNCSGCCNKSFDLDNLPKVESYSGWDKIMLTGGEPMLRPKIVMDTVHKIRKNNKNCKIILYTAMPNSILLHILHYIDGLTITLHEQKDVDQFDKFECSLDFYSSFIPNLNNKSLRLNVFNNINLWNERRLDLWKIKNNIEWIKDCPLPRRECFMKL